MNAMDRGVIRQLYEDGIAQYWDDDAYQAALELEVEHDTTLALLQRLAGGANA
jgi:hypothetical protein